jgi:hypothetical protein
MQDRLTPQCDTLFCCAEDGAHCETSLLVRVGTRPHLAEGQVLGRSTAVVDVSGSEMPQQIPLRLSALTEVPSEQRAEIARRRAMGAHRLRCSANDVGVVGEALSVKACSNGS